MRVELLVALVCVVFISVSRGVVLGPQSNKQELFVYREQIYILHEVLDEDCPGYTDIKRQLSDDRTITFHLQIAKKLYHKLIESLIECQAIKEARKANSTVTTTAATTTTAPTTTTPTTATATPLPRDCQELYERGERADGVYEISIVNSTIPPFNVWCDFFDNHGWTVFQKRFDGSVNFYRGWVDYENGFGSPSGEYWLGNKKLHALTNTNRRLNIYVEKAGGSSANGTWTDFGIGDASEKYMLSVNSSGYTGDLTQASLEYHNGMKFSTKDQDNDVWSYGSRNCAVSYTGAWWYKVCAKSNLNGVYNKNNGGGVYWSGFSLSITTSIMRITRT